MWTAVGQTVLVASVASAVLSGLLVGSVLSLMHGEEIAKLKLEHRDLMMKGWEAAHKVNAEVTEKFNEDLATIANRPPPRPILVCPKGGAVLPGAAAGASPEASGGFQGETGGETRRDIGAFVAGEANRADQCAAQLNSLIDWVNRVRQP